MSGDRDRPREPSERELLEADLLDADIMDPDLVNEIDPEVDPSAVIGHHVVFSHGSEGSPLSEKIAMLSEAARSEGFEAHAIDYRGVDSVTQRVQMLTDTCRSLSGELVLVGSSLGGYVSLAAAASIHATGVFLMAPALYTEGLPPLPKRSWDCPATIIHAWEDDVVPVEHSIRFARENRLSLHLVNGNHRLSTQMPVVRHLFEHFILGLSSRAKLL